MRFFFIKKPPIFILKLHFQSNNFPFKISDFIFLIQTCRHTKIKQTHWQKKVRKGVWSQETGIFLVDFFHQFFLDTAILIKNVLVFSMMFKNLKKFIIEWIEWKIIWLKMQFQNKNWSLFLHEISSINNFFFKRAKAELAQHLAEDPLPLRRAKLTTQSATKKAEKAREVFRLSYFKITNNKPPNISCVIKVLHKSKNQSVKKCAYHVNL